MAKRSSMRSPGGLVALSLLVALAGCGGGPGELRYATGRHAGVSPDGLHRVKTWGGMAERVYVKPGADLHGYDEVMLEPVVVRFALSSARTLDRETVVRVKQSFHEIFVKELEKSVVYRLVDEPGPHVLRVTPQLVDIVVSARQRPGTPDEQVVIQTAGAATVVLELSDSLSHAALVRAYDRRPIGDQTGTPYRDRPGANLAKARLVFIQWAQRLRSWLDNVRQIPPLPGDAGVQAN